VIPLIEHLHHRRAEADGHDDGDGEAAHAHSTRSVALLEGAVRAGARARERPALYFAVDAAS
jgi:hypothetical protein